MPDSDSYGQGIQLAILGDAPDAQQLVSDLEKIIGRTVMVFESSSHRGATLSGTSGAPSPTEGMVSYLKDSNALEFYNGSAWRPLQEALPSLPRGTLGYTRSTSGTSNLSGTSLVANSKITFTCSTSRRYRVTVTCSWISTSTGLSAGVKIAAGYAVGSTLPSDGSSTFEIIAMSTGAAALNIAVPVSLQHEFNGPTSNEISVGVFATNNAGSGNRVTNESCCLAIHDIGVAQ